MISYNTYFKDVLKQYEDKLKHNPSFFGDRTDQEAMGFLVAVNSYKAEILHPEDKTSHSIKSSVNAVILPDKLPVESNSYIESEIGKWLYDIEILARRKAKELNDFTLSNEEIADKIFRDKFYTPTRKSLKQNFLFFFSFLPTIVVCLISLIITMFLLIIYVEINPHSFIITKTWGIYLVISMLYTMVFYLPTILPTFISGPTVKNFFASKRAGFNAILIIATIYIIPQHMFVEPKVKATIFLATTILLALVIRSLFMNTSIPTGYYDLNFRRMKIFLEISTAELAFTSTIMFVEPINEFLMRTRYLFLWLISLFLIALLLSSFGTKYFDKFLSHIY